MAIHDNRQSVTFLLPAAGKYKLTTSSDPRASNAIFEVREVTL